MKSHKQILALFKMAHPLEVKDELAIESFLARQGIYIKLSGHKKKAVADTQPFTFEEFRDWFEKELPACGDVIVSEEKLTGIVRDVKVNSIVLGVCLDKNDDFITSDTEIPIHTYRNAREDEIIRLQRVFNQKNLSWNQYKGEICVSMHPQNNLQLRLSHLGKKIAVGVFKEINEKGEIVMYCVKEENKPVRFSLHEVVGPAINFQFEPVNVLERKKFAAEMELMGKVWNGHAKRVEPVDFRVKKGSVYYYIDDYMEIRATMDNYKPKDQKRLRSGNYFQNTKEAEIILKLIVDTRNTQLSKYMEVPSKNKTKK